MVSSHNPADRNPDRLATNMNLTFQCLLPEDIQSVSLLIERAFQDSVAPTLSDEGIANFLAGISPVAIEKRLSSGNMFIVCKTDHAIVGVGEIRAKSHLNLFFVEPGMQRKGIGRHLLLNLLSRVREKEITVNSSFNAINVYKRLGFRACGAKSETGGIKYQPMMYRPEAV